MHCQVKGTTPLTWQQQFKQQTTMKKENARELLIKNGFTEKETTKVLKSIRTFDFESTDDLLLYAYKYFGPYQTSLDMLYKAFIYHTNFKPVAAILVDDYINSEQPFQIYTTYDKAKKLALDYIKHLCFRYSLAFFGTLIDYNNPMVNDDGFKYVFGVHYYYYRVKQFTMFNDKETLADLLNIVNSLNIKYNKLGHNFELVYKDFIEYKKNEFLDYIQECNFKTITYAFWTNSPIIECYTLTKNKSHINVFNKVKEINIDFEKDNIPFSFKNMPVDNVYVLNRVHD